MLHAKLFRNCKNVSQKLSDYVGDGQVVIFGKQGHAEVNGLVGQTSKQCYCNKTSFRF